MIAEEQTQSTALIAEVQGAAPVAPAAAVKFEIADIHSSWRRYNPYPTGGSLVGDRYVIRQVTALDLIRAAYGIEEAHILGGPMWLESKRYEVLAKAPKGATNADLQPMLRALLADRFKLVVRDDTKAMPAYLLSVGKGEPKLKKAEPSEQSGCGFKAQSPQPAPGVAGSTPPDVTAFCKNATMEQLAEMLHSTERYPVVDKTGLKGNWDFEFHFAWTPRPDGLTVADALKGQLGLKLELGTAPLPVEVVESVEEPSPNSPDLDKLMPPPANQEFEVAVIKPVPPHTRTNVQVNGDEFSIGGGTMQFLIMYSYDVNEAALVDIPPWFLTKRWAITAKIPVDPAAKNTNVDMEDVKAMLRSLLADRFNLKVHEEVRPSDGWELVAAGPKLKKAADTEIRPTCGNGPGPDGKDPRAANPALLRLITCQNVSMAEFAERLSSLFNYRTPVLDGTGLTGRYDLQLLFTGDREILAATQAASASGAAGGSAGVDAASGVSDPTGAISLMDAFPKELGLKLEHKKEPVPVLVVDHIEETPTEN
jgi:uncharacterized protein (TIGR03435 family)